jgi:hypothetical protein
MAPAGLSRQSLGATAPENRLVQPRGEPPMSGTAEILDAVVIGAGQWGLGTYAAAATGSRAGAVQRRGEALPGG